MCMGILKSNTRSWSLCIIIINYCVIIIIIINAYYIMHDIIIVLLIKASSRNAIGKKTWQYLGLLMPPVCKEGRKTFSSMSNIRPFTTRPAVLYSQCYLVASVIHIQSTQSRMWSYTHSSQYTDSGLAKEIKQKMGYP
jgi:hypothetical protein